jgi:hypothetical protein
METKIRISQTNQEELRPDDLISLGRILKLVEFIFDEYQFKSKTPIKGKPIPIAMRRKMFRDKPKVSICAINKNSPFEICLGIEFGLITGEVFEIIFSRKFMERIIRFYEIQIKGSRLTEKEKISIYLKYSEWSSTLKVIRRLALVYHNNNC